MSRVQLFVLFALLAHICVGDGDEFVAFKDLCLAASQAAPTALKCVDNEISCGGVIGTCVKDHIVYLKAFNQGINKLPDTMNNMVYLKQVNVANNNLEALPVLDKLTRLNIFLMYNNKITNFTGVFVNSKSLQAINAGNNKLVELPPELGNMVNLTTLNVNNNELTEIPSTYENLIGPGFSLRYFDISGNKFDCTVVRGVFSGLIADSCIQSQQRTEQEVPALPLVYPDEQARAGLNGYEIASIILGVLFVCLLIPAIILYINFRKKPFSTEA